MSHTLQSFRVANLANLFWDNGSYKYPNTYPKLINSWSPNKTPVMTSPTTGWVILEGDWNYCEYNGNLFFLKKVEVISISRNKWKYVLIKDHICSLFKNRADVIAYGTLVNTDLDNLKDNDFQYTFPVFNNYNKRILIPLEKELFNWRKHSRRIEITKTFEPYCPWTDVDFSNFVWQLEETNNFFTKSGGETKLWSEVVKNNDYLVILGSFGACKNKVKGWKRELVDKINALLRDIPNNEEIVLGVIANDVMTSASRLNGRVAISYKRDNPLFTIQDETREIDIDLSGLTDIELINFDRPSEHEKYSRDQFNLFLSYSENKVTSDVKDSYSFKVSKLSRRVRIPFIDPSSSRAIYKSSTVTKDKFRTFAWNPWGSSGLYSPQKIFIKGAQELIPKAGRHHYVNYPTRRFAGENYRSVYLYWCFNLNFYFAWGPNILWSSEFPIEEREDFWIKGEEYFKGEEKNVLREISENKFVANSKRDGIIVVPCVRHWQDITRESQAGRLVELVAGGREFLVNARYSNYYPWNTLREPINIGWLLGQFSTYISGQENYFEPKFPFVVKTAVTKGNRLKRLQGFKDEVGNLIHLDELYDASGFQHKFTLDIFNPLSVRQTKNSLEEDFLIGEKLLFTSWGMAPYILFQPFSLAGDDIRERLTQKDNQASVYGTLDISGLDNRSHPQLLLKWLTDASYHYGYDVFDYTNSYWLPWAKGWYKKAYQNYEPLTYKRFYYSDSDYGELKQHIIKNTGAYFKTDEVTFSNTPLEELKVGDIFYSDLEWFWFDASGGVGGKLDKALPSDFLIHERVIPEFQHGDIVCYINPKDNKIYLGEVKIWKSVMNLPPNQFIAAQPKDDNSHLSSVNITYTRITPATDERVIRGGQSFDSLETLLSALKEARYLKQNQPKDLKQLQDTGRSFLFNLKGTPFFCALDRKGKVSLIFKNKEKYEASEHIDD